MKCQSVSILFIFLVSSGILRAQQNQDSQVNVGKEKISEVIYWVVGGGRPGFLKIKITRDSICYENEVYSDKTGETNVVVKKTKNRRKNWFALINSVNLADFDQLKSGQPQSPLDGEDAMLCINTQLKERRLILNSENSEKILDFILNLESDLQEFHVKVNVQR